MMNVMNLIKCRHCRIRCFILSVMIACTLLAQYPASAYAGYTEIGEPGTKSYVTKKSKLPVILFVGDSRSMMCTYQGGKQSARKNFCFLWVNGGNASVIKNKKGVLAPYLKKKIKKYRKRCVVVFNLGVNGNSHPKSNAKRIIRIYKWWMKHYPDVRFFVASVNPTITNSGPYSNKNVKKVNKYLEKEFRPEGIYIDTYSHLMKSGLITGKASGMRDNYHYKWSAAKKILTKVRKSVTASLRKTAAEKRTKTVKAKTA